MGIFEVVILDDVCCALISEFVTILGLKVSVSLTPRSMLEIELVGNDYMKCAAAVGDPCDMVDISNDRKVDANADEHVNGYEDIGYHVHITLSSRVCDIDHRLDAHSQRVIVHDQAELLVHRVNDADADKKHFEVEPSQGDLQHFERNCRNFGGGVDVLLPTTATKGEFGHVTNTFYTVDGDAVLMSLGNDIVASVDDVEIDEPRLLGLELCIDKRCRRQYDPRAPYECYNGFTLRHDDEDIAVTFYGEPNVSELDAAGATEGRHEHAMIDIHEQYEFSHCVGDDLWHGFCGGSSEGIFGTHELDHTGEERRAVWVLHSNESSRAAMASAL